MAVARSSSESSVIAALEQARYTYALEVERRDRELEIRIQQAARQRPGWTVALTATAILVASVMAYVAAADHTGHAKFVRGQGVNLGACVGQVLCGKP